MSLASYIGCNITIPINDENTDNLIYIGSCFADDDNLQNVKNYQFSTSYIYEVSSDWGIEISEYIYPTTCTESKMKLKELCKIMDSYLDKGDYFELYSCWVGEETEKRVGTLTLKIDNFDVDQVNLPEKTLVRIEK